METTGVSHFEVLNEAKQISSTENVDESLQANIVMIKVEPDLDLNDGDDGNGNGNAWKCLNKKSTTSNKLNDRKVMKKRNRSGRKKHTSYTLYSTDVRPQILSENPNLDHLSICRKISQRWANLSKDEKDDWHMKAKRLRLTNLAHFLNKKSIEAESLSNAK